MPELCFLCFLIFLFRHPDKQKEDKDKKAASEKFAKIRYGGGGSFFEKRSLEFRDSCPDFRLFSRN